MNWKLWLAIPAMSTCVTGFSQADADTAFVNAAKMQAVALHQEALGTQSRLYNGSRYVDPEFSIEQHPFFLSEDWITGSVFYDGEYFGNVPLMYDLLNDALVAEHGPSGHAIQLIRNKLRHFTVREHYFERIEKDTLQNSLPATGFYEILYNGPSRLVARRQKFSREEIVDSDVATFYEEKNRYFILMNDVFFSVKNKSSVLKLMNDKKQELKKYLKQQGISFSENREAALKSLAEHYDSLK